MTRKPGTHGVERLIYSAWNYWFVFAVDLLAALVLLILGIRIFTGSPLAMVAWIVGGFVAWGGIEYAVHRWVFHGPPSVITRAHARHHADGLALIGAPAFMSVVLAGVLWALLSIPLTAGAAALALCGLYAGYDYYAIVHHLQHRRSTLLARVPYFARLEQAHRTHHRRFVVNYGVTTTWWDHLFASYQPPGDSSRTRS